MRVKEQCDKLLSFYYEKDDIYQGGSLAYQLVSKLRSEINPEIFSNTSLIPILETTKKIALQKGKFKHVLEGELLSLIAYLPYRLWRDFVEDDSQFFERNAKSREGQIAESLVGFAKEIYDIKIDRDAFAGKRRGFSLRILENLSDFFEVPELMELCLKSVKNKSKNEFLRSIDCLLGYYLERNETPSEEIIEIIDKRIEKTKHRGEAVSGLNLQVETGLISEFEALSRLDEWEEKNDVW